jgi:hypothetical protein
MVPIPDEAWATIDKAIFANMKLPAIKEIRALAGCGISDAVFMLSDRYKMLRAESPERFVCSHEECWEGFYS